MISPPQAMSPDLADNTKIHISLQCGGILGIVSAIGCFAFIAKKLEINHAIKKLLLFATMQQGIFNSTFLYSVSAIITGLRNKLICYLAVTSVMAALIGSQASISMISIIR